MSSERTRESSAESFSEIDLVERSPCGRFCRFKKLRSEVFLGFDTETGREVAWTVNSADKAWLNLAKKLNHPRILKPLNSWLVGDTTVVITNRIASCSLRQYVGRLASPLKSAIVKNWATQILEGLAYLHSKNISPQNFSCQTCFINGADSTVQISIFHKPTQQRLPIQISDIHKFGLILLEIVTRRKCDAEDGAEKIGDDNLRKLFSCCFSVSKPSVVDLLNLLRKPSLEDCCTAEPLHAESLNILIKSISNYLEIPREQLLLFFRHC